MITIPYRPYKKIDKYYLTSTGGIPQSLDFKNGKASYKLIIKPSGYVPKSGLLLCQTIENSVRGKQVLDIGTGETGIIAIHCSKHGAKEITACDIDPKAVEWSKVNGKLNKIENIKWINSNTFKKIRGKFDVIISNPPQMPMTHGSLHDSGGIDGRKVIEEIIQTSPKFLKKKGVLYLLFFDFLGIDKSYGRLPSLFQILKRNSFEPSIINITRRNINPAGKTMESIPIIKMSYPDFYFKKDAHRGLFHKIYIVKGVLKN